MPAFPFHRWIALFALALTGAGCAVGATVGGASARLGPSDSSLCASCANNGPVSASLGYYELQVLDYSGLLLAGLTSAADSYNERQRAIDDARARGAKAGDTVTYEVTPRAALPGIRTELLVRYSSGVDYLFDGNTAVDERGLPVEYETRSYFGFDLENDWAPIFLGDLPLSFQPQMNARIENYTADRKSTWGAGYDIGDFHADVYLGAGLNYMVLPNLLARAELDVGIVSPFMALMGYGTLSHTTQLQVVYQPLNWVFVRGYAGWKRQNLIERGVNAFQAGVGVGVGAF